MRYKIIVMCLSALLLLTVSVLTVTLLLKKHVPLLNPEGLSSSGCILDFRYPDETNCTTFYICTPDGLQIFSCPLGLHFNPVVKKCDSPDVAGCTKDIQDSLPLTTITESFNITEDVYITDYQLLSSDDESVLQTHGTYFEENSLETSSLDTLQSERTTTKNDLLTYSSNVPYTDVLVNSTANFGNNGNSSSDQNLENSFTDSLTVTDALSTKDLFEMNTEIVTNEIENEESTTLQLPNSTKSPEKLTLITKSDAMETKYSTIPNTQTKISTETSLIQNSTDVLENKKETTKITNENEQTLSTNLNIENFTLSTQNFSEWNNNEYEYSLSEKNEPVATQLENSHDTTRPFLETTENLTLGNDNTNVINILSSDSTFLEKSTKSTFSVDGTTVTENNSAGEEMLYDKVSLSQINTENDLQTLTSFSDINNNDISSNFNSQASYSTTSKPEILNNPSVVPIDLLENVTLDSSYLSTSPENNTTDQSNYLTSNKNTKNVFLTESTLVLNESTTNAWKPLVTEVNNHSSSNNPIESTASQTLQTSSLNIAEVKDVLNAIKELHNNFNNNSHNQISGNNNNDNKSEQDDAEDDDEEEEEHRHHHKHKHHHG